jgi:hypothetical protein
MSTMSPIFDIDFQGRRPSKAQIMSKIKAAIQSGAAAISVSWGENRLDLDYSFNARAWNGYGWIKAIGGDDIAKELNKAQVTEAALKARIRAQGCSLDFIENRMIIKVIG